VTFLTATRVPDVTAPYQAIRGPKPCLFPRSGRAPRRSRQAAQRLTATVRRSCRPRSAGRPIRPARKNCKCLQAAV